MGDKMKKYLIVEKHSIQKILTMCTTSAMTGLICASVAASDIDIYKQARSGDITLMMLLDISGSMGMTNTSACDLESESSLNGSTIHNENSTNGSPTYKRYYCKAIDKTYKYRSYRSSIYSSYNRYQACTNDAPKYESCTWGPEFSTKPNDLPTDYDTRSNIRYHYVGMDRKYYQRITRLKDAMFDLLHGNTAKGIIRISDEKIIGLSTLGVKTTNSYANTGAVLVPARRLDAMVGTKTHRQVLLDEIAKLEASTNTPTARSYAETVSYLMGTTTSGVNYSGFSYSNDSTKNITGTLYSPPTSFQQTDEAKQCSGQGVYVLTDGDPVQDDDVSPLMVKALNTTSTSFSCTSSNSDSFDCLNKMALRLINPATNPSGLKIKTAVVGFGNNFNNVTSYDKGKTQAQNIAALGNIGTNVKRAAYWGIIGEGGWYSGSSSQDVIESVNGFISDLGSEIPAVTTGTSTIPIDPLNPTVLQNYSYFPQFQPTPDKKSQSWVGNLKKYSVDVNGILRDRLGAIFVDTNGKILSNQDLWAPVLSNTPTDAETATAFMGGIKSQLILRHSNLDQTNRKVFTTRDFDGDIAHRSATFIQVKLDDFEDDTKKNDPKLGYLMNLLGYSYNPTLRPTNFTIDKLKEQTELRQVGAVMHSSPILLTNQGRIQFNSATNSIETIDRKDYIVFGTTQGVLHVVDAITGKEKFAFVPNEMIESQAEAFASPDLTSAGLQKLYYGIDGPWTSYTEYVTAKNDKDLLTVGDGDLYEGVVNKGKQYVYGGLRMGGRDYYALDLADIDNPSLKFQISPTGECNATNPLGCMGQSWSKPTVAWVKWKGVKKLVMFVGGGYDAGGDDGNAYVNGVRLPYAGYESDSYNQTNKRGAGVYMFDAEDGDLLWWTGANATENTGNILATSATDMKYSVVSEIKAVDRDSDGLVDHLYFGDLGGQLWRVDLNNQLSMELSTAQPELFARTPSRILNLNKGSASPRFYEKPAFSTYNTNGKIFGVVSIGSGNRSMPLAEYTATQTNYLNDGIYNIYDKDVARIDLFSLVSENSVQSYKIASSTFLTQNTTLQAENETGISNESLRKLIAISDNNRFSTNNNTAPYSLSSGWYYLFKSQKIQSEKVMSTPLVINNDMYVTTFDGSRDGLSGDCGAGVKGESFMTLFCMPYGQCSSGSADDYRLNLGAGIVGGAIGAGDVEGMIRRIVATKDMSGVSASNVILGRKYETANSLVPQRWYIKQ